MSASGRLRPLKPLTIIYSSADKVKRSPCSRNFQNFCDNYSFNHSFIHFEHFCSAPSRNYVKKLISEIRKCRQLQKDFLTKGLASRLQWGLILLSFICTR